MYNINDIVGRVWVKPCCSRDAKAVSYDCCVSICLLLVKINVRRGVTGADTNVGLNSNLRDTFLQDARWPSDLGRSSLHFNPALTTS